MRRPPQSGRNGGDDDSAPKLPFRRLIALARPELPRLGIATFFLLIGSGVGLAYPKAVQWLIDGSLIEGGQDQLDRAAIVLIVLFVVQAVMSALRYALFTIAGERVVTRLRRELYAAILRQPVAFFDSSSTGELTNRLSADTTTLQNTVTVNLSMVLRSLVSAIGGMTLLIITSSRLAVLMVVVVPPVALATALLGRRIQKLARRTQDALAEAGSVAQETIAGVRTVRAFAREGAEIERYAEAVDESLDAAVKRTHVVAMIIAATWASAFSSIVVVLWFGGRQVLAGSMSVGELTSFILYTAIVAMSVSVLGDLGADFLRARGAAARVFELIDRVPEVALDGGRTLDEVEGRVSLLGVDFAYPSRPDAKVLEGLQLELAPGEVVAAVGSSGAGKSTLAALLMRLYEPTSGRLELDGVPYDELDASWLRRQIGIVAQDPVLFSTSVAENIRYGRPSASLDEVKRAAEVANAAIFIEDFPDGYDTLVGERGVQLSGGQRQRVAIARAVLEDPALLILDEATSALDSESEHLVQQALERLMTQRTALVIAHRLSTVKNADRILVMDDGQIVESGKHDELLAASGLYARLVERQLAG